MSFPDPSPPPSFMPPPFAGDAGSFWHQIPMNNEDLDTNFDYAPPSKRARSSGNYQPSSTSFPPLNPRMNMPNPHVNKGTGHIFYKTRMCLKFMEGNCRNGEQCTFAHGPEDLREPPPNWQEIVAAREKEKGMGNWNDDQRIIHKMKICRKFYNGEECPYGDNCNFLHENPSKFKKNNEQGSPRESSAISIGTTGSMMGPRAGTGQPEVNRQGNNNPDAFRFNTKPTYWKTKLCSKWEITGYCPFGERCHFAHGQSELQLPGGRIEAETVNTITIPTKPVSVPGVDAPLSKIAVSAPVNEDAEGEKCFSKWKGTKKINRIYADWIDDLTLPLSLPNKVKS
ncbi:hypothetical protein NMG60_11013307 [Bertholletia excelsa]